MAIVKFSRTETGLGPTAVVIVSVGYQHGWHLLPFTNGQATYDFPQSLQTFVLLVQIQGAASGGKVAIGMTHADGAALTPATYEHDVTPAEAASGLPVDRIDFNAVRSWVSIGLAPSFSESASHLALVPKTVTRSSAAMSHRICRSRTSGAPS